MASAVFVASPTVADVAPTIPVGSVAPIKLQNVDPGETLYLFESPTMPPAGTVGHRVFPGDWYTATLAPDNRLWGWSDRACSVVVSGRSDL